MTPHEYCPECHTPCLYVRTRGVALHHEYSNATEHTWRCPNCSEEFYSLVNGELAESG